MLKNRLSSARICGSCHRTLAVVTLVCLIVSTAFAEDVSILWDISKSVPHELYSQQVVQTVLALVLGKGIPTGWKVTLPGEPPDSLSAVLAGKQPMILPGDQILIVHFGSLHREMGSNLPFWNTNFRVTDLSALPGRLSNQFPKASTDDWTNKYLAEAAAARWLYDQGSKSWFSIAISDFNEDNKTLLLPQESEFVDAYDAQLFASLSAVAVIRLEANPSVIIKVRYSTSKAKGSSTSTKLPDLFPKAPLVLISPQSNASFSSSKPTAFSWRWSGDDIPKSYRVVVTAIEPALGTVINEQTQATVLTPRKILEPAKYRWQVYALLESKTVSSAAGSFSVEGSIPLGSTMLALLLLAAIIGVLIYFNKQRRGAQQRK